MKPKDIWRALSFLLYSLESGLKSRWGDKLFWTQVLSWLNLSACWLQENWEMVPAQGPWEFTAAPAVGKKLPVQRPPCPWQVGFRCSPSHWKRGTFSPSPLVTNPQRRPGSLHKHHPWSCTLENHKFWLGRESLSSALAPTAMGGCGGPRGCHCSILMIMETTPMSPRIFKMVKGPKPHPQKTVKNTSECLAGMD